MRRYLMLFCFAGCCTQAPDVSVWAVPDVPAASAPVWVTDEIHDSITPDTTPDLFDERDSDDAIPSKYYVGDFCLVDYFRSFPPCPPCIRWNANEKAAVRCEVEQWDTSERPLEWLESVPTFRLFWCNPETKQWDQVRNWGGFTSADSINAEIEKHREDQASQSQAVTVSLPNQQLRLTEYDLRSWINEHYTPMSRLDRATVTPQSWVWTHLKQDHGFNQDQVGGLPLWMALALHDAVHPRSSPLITPWMSP